MADFLAAIIALGFFIIIFIGPPVLFVLLVIKLVRKSEKRKTGQYTKTQANHQYNPPYGQSPNSQTYSQTYFTDEMYDVDEQYDNAYLPYRRSTLLTKRELGFYSALKPIADAKGLTVLAKIRVGDLVQIGAYEKNRQTYLNKVSRKHVDFALANPQNLEIVLLIELDDFTHDDSKRYDRDRFLESVFEKTGYNFLRVRTTENLKQRIDEILQ